MQVGGRFYGMGQEMTPHPHTHTHSHPNLYFIYISDNKLVLCPMNYTSKQNDVTCFGLYCVVIMLRNVFVKNGELKTVAGWSVTRKVSTKISPGFELCHLPKSFRRFGWHCSCFLRGECHVYERNGI